MAATTDTGCSLRHAAAKVKANIAASEARLPGPVALRQRVAIMSTMSMRAVLRTVGRAATQKRASNCAG